MQPEDKVPLFQLSSRYDEYCFVKSNSRNGSPREVFFEREGNGGAYEGSEQTAVNTLTAGGHSGGKHSSMTLLQLNNPTHSNNRIYGDKPLSPALNTAQGGNRQPKIMRHPLKFMTRNQKNIEGDYAFCVDGANTGGIVEGSRIRRLTPTECCRLMSWPDDWNKWGIDSKGNKVEISDSQRYKQCGNGVVSNVVEIIVRELIKPAPYGWLECQPC